MHVVQNKTMHELCNYATCMQHTLAAAMCSGEPRRVLAAITIRVLARAQVPLDLALVDQVVVLPFPDDPDTPEKNVARSHAKSHACTCRTKGDAGHAGLLVYSSSRSTSC